MASLETIAKSVGTVALAGLAVVSGYNGLEQYRNYKEPERTVPSVEYTDEHEEQKALMEIEQVKKKAHGYLGAIGMLFISGVGWGLYELTKRKDDEVLGKTYDGVQR